MKNLKSFLTGSMALILGFTLMTGNVIAQPKPWTVPAEYKTKKNPVANDETSNKAGMALYNKNCASCHGKAGLGDGVKARMLKDFPGDRTAWVLEGRKGNDALEARDQLGEKAVAGEVAHQVDFLVGVGHGDAVLVARQRLAAEAETDRSRGKRPSTRLVEIDPRRYYTFTENAVAPWQALRDG